GEHFRDSPADPLCRPGNDGDRLTLHRARLSCRSCKNNPTRRRTLTLVRPWLLELDSYAQQPYRSGFLESVKNGKGSPLNLAWLVRRCSQGHAADAGEEGHEPALDSKPRHPAAFLRAFAGQRRRHG